MFYWLIESNVWFFYFCFFQFFFSFFLTCVFNLCYSKNPQGIHAFCTVKKKNVKKCKFKWRVMAHLFSAKLVRNWNGHYQKKWYFVRQFCLQVTGKILLKINFINLTFFFALLFCGVKDTDCRWFFHVTKSWIKFLFFNLF